MSNFISNPAMTPNLQTQGEFPFLDFNNRQTDFRESDFSKALDAAVESRRKGRSEVPSAHKQETAPSQEATREGKSRPTEKPEQPERRETAPAGKQPEPKPKQTAVDESGKANHESDPEKTADTADTGEETPEAKTGQEAEAAQAPAIAQLLMEMAADPQPAAGSIELPVTASEPEAATGVTGVNASGAGETVDFTGELLSKQAGADGIAAAVETAGEQASQGAFARILSGRSEANPVVQGQSSSRQSANSPAETVRAAGDLASLSGMNPVRKQAGQNGDNSEPQFPEVPKGEVKELRTAVSGAGTAGTLPKTGGQKDLLNPNLTKTVNTGETGEGTEEAGVKTGSATDSPAVIQAAAKEGKPQSLNLPLIQTQLSVNGSDKTRSDLPVFQVPPQQQTVPATPEVPGAAAGNAGREELFAQIVEKARVMVNNGHSEMEVSLKPDHLGKLQLKVSVENQTVTAKFVAESQQVKEIIETNLNHLRRNLQETGVQVDAIMVSVGHQNNGGDFQETGNYHGGFNNGNNYSHRDGEIESGMEKDLPENRPVQESLVDLIA